MQCGVRAPGICIFSIQFNLIELYINYAQMAIQYLVLVTGQNVYVKARMDKNNKGKQNEKYMDYQD